MELGEGQYFCGSELTFIQIAANHSLCATVVLGYELCGCYSHFPKMVSGFYGRPALTSVDRLRKTIDLFPRMRGTHKAREALKWVKDGSASPMETIVACALTLPASMGGAGFLHATLNHEVTLDPIAAALAGRKTCRVDLAWPEFRVGLEYDSEAFHKNPTSDLARREALSHMGYQIVTLDLARIGYFPELKKVISFLGSVLPQRHGGCARDSDLKGLLRRLRRATRMGVGLENTLFPVNVPHGLLDIHV